jgi:hypothetical protein
MLVFVSNPHAQCLLGTATWADLLLYNEFVSEIFWVKNHADMTLSC